MDDDVRLALWVGENADPGVAAPVAQWQAMAPHFVASAQEERAPGWAAAPVKALLGVGAANRYRPASRRVAYGTLLAGLALLVVSASQARTGNPGRLIATQPRHAPVIVVADFACPANEARYDNVDAGYHLCRPARWITHDYSGHDGLLDAVSVVGMGEAGETPSRSQIDAGGPVAEVLITVAFQNLGQVERAENLYNPTLVDVAGQPAHLFQNDTASGHRVLVLVERAERLYRIELNSTGGAEDVEFREVLRTFTFKSLPHSADPEFRLNRNTA
jgi:hypothetical protein